MSTNITSSKNNSNKENTDIDLIIDEIKSIEIPLPNTLDQRINETIESLPKRKKHMMRYMMEVAAGFVFLILSFSILIYSNEAFASISREIPGLNVLTDLLIGDRGVQNAAKNNYPIIDTMRFNDGDYEVNLSTVMIDEERMTFVASANYIDPLTLNKTPIRSQDFFINLYDSTGCSSSASYSQDFLYEGTINFDLNNSTFLRDLATNELPLVLACDFYEDKSTIEKNDASLDGDDDIPELVYSMTNMAIPMTLDQILLNRSVDFDYTLSFNEGSIDFDTLTISPTKMQLHGFATPLEEPLIHNNQEGYVTHIDMNEFTVYYEGSEDFGKPSLTQYGLGDGDIWYQLVPSIYFDTVEKLTVQYDSYSFTLDHEPYLISLNDSFPLTLDYFGYDIVIEDIIVNKNRLTVKHYIPDETNFTFQSFDILGFDLDGPGISDGHGVSMIEDDNGNRRNEYYSYFKIDSKPESIELILSFPKIIIYEGGEFDIPIQ